MPATATYVTAPSYEQLETAWWNLAQGELGLDRDHDTARMLQAMFDHTRRIASSGGVTAADGEPVKALNSDEMARRMVTAYAVLVYGA